MSIGKLSLTFATLNFYDKSSSDDTKLFRMTFMRVNFQNITRYVVLIDESSDYFLFIFRALELIWKVDDKFIFALINFKVIVNKVIFWCLTEYTYICYAMFVWSNFFLKSEKNRIWYDVLMIFVSVIKKLNV